MDKKRRNFLKIASASSFALAGLSLAGCYKNNSSMPKALNTLKKDHMGLLDLPDFLNYKVVSRTNDLMTDGLKVPDRPDGMTCIDTPNNTITLIKNHEIGNPNYPNSFDTSLSKKDSYDLAASSYPYTGGTTNLVLNKDNLETVKHYRSLLGTISNCAVGTTPWGTWISCEETRVKNHGYAFEVFPSDKSIKANRLTNLGRFKREAVAINKKTGIVYQTEDDRTGLFYRYIPSEKNNLYSKGKLQALKVIENIDLRNRNGSIQTGYKFDVEWVTIDDFKADKQTTMDQGLLKGAMPFDGGEGIINDNNSIYFTCKRGGQKLFGQLFKYNPSEFEGTKDENKQPPTIEIFYESYDENEYSMGDNIVVSPWGDLIICEDHGHSGCRLIGMTTSGRIYHIAQVSNSYSELAGVCFSKDSKYMFVNVQDEGKTVAIYGDWSKINTLKV